MNQALDPRTRIPGWGADLDRRNRPAVPMERMPNRLEGVHWEQPEQQAQHVEILQSTERPGMPPVFGSSVPPSGISGSIRRQAFGYSENDLRHWLMLLAADRVNVLEGVAQDLRRSPHAGTVALAAALGAVTWFAVRQSRRGRPLAED